MSRPRRLERSLFDLTAHDSCLRTFYRLFVVHKLRANRVLVTISSFLVVLNLMRSAKGIRVHILTDGCDVVDGSWSHGETLVSVLGVDGDGLNAGLGAGSLTPQVLRRLKHSGGLGDSEEPDSSSASEFL
ncbi:hypothetical protein Drorol1_Dr00022500 [Drosera rotundifolia]